MRPTLDPGAFPAQLAGMDLPEDDRAFLRDLVKTSRQRAHHFPWKDRDGTTRLTALTAAEATRLHAIASQLGTSAPDVLRQAAHVPVAKAPPR